MRPAHFLLVIIIALLVGCDDTRVRERTLQPLGLDIETRADTQAIGVIIQVPPPLILMPHYGLDEHNRNVRGMFSQVWEYAIYEFHQNMVKTRTETEYVQEARMAEFNRISELRFHQAALGVTIDTLAAETGWNVVRVQVLDGETIREVARVPNSEADMTLLIRPYSILDTDCEAISAESYIYVLPDSYDSADEIAAVDSELGLASTAVRVAEPVNPGERGPGRERYRMIEADDFALYRAKMERVIRLSAELAVRDLFADAPLDVAYVEQRAAEFLAEYGEEADIEVDRDSLRETLGVALGRTDFGESPLLLPLHEPSDGSSHSQN